MNAQGMQATVRRALLAAGLDRADVDLLILHGTGTRMNDAMESRCVQELVGEVDQQPWWMSDRGDYRAPAWSFKFVPVTCRRAGDSSAALSLVPPIVPSSILNARFA